MGHACLNPFEFRAGVKLSRCWTIWAVPLRLNPFEFRAGVKHAARRILNQQLRLNPFEFRAGVKRHGSRATLRVIVLIPLNSGLGSNKTRKGNGELPLES